MQVMLKVVLDVVGVKMFVGYFYNINGCVLDNIDVVLEVGIRCFDVFVGGLGGCFYVLGVQGNVVIEVVVVWLYQQGMKIGVDLGVL